MSRVTRILCCFAVLCALADTAAMANGDSEEQPPPAPPADIVDVGPGDGDVGPGNVEVGPGNVELGSGGDSGLLLLVLFGAVVMGLSAQANDRSVQLGLPVILDDDLESGAGTGKY